MPKPGLSLFGFMEEPVAVNYLNMICALPDKSLPILQQFWAEARGRLGSPIPNAGYPDIQDIPKNYKSYLQGVANKNPRYQDTIGTLPASFKLVEIDPLLAFQFHIETERISDAFASNNGQPSTFKQLELCLPQKVDEVPQRYEFYQDGSAMIKISDVNINILGKGSIGGDPDKQVNALGIVYGLTSPLVQVVRLNGRCYLRNGFHRAYILRKVGISHIPCVFLEGSNFVPDIIPPNRTIFSQTLLESDNPPTCGHFSQDRAYPVTLKGITRFIHVSWSMYDLLGED